MAGRALLLVGIVLTAQLCGCTAYVGGGGGLSVEFIHRDSAKSPFHDPSLTAHGRVIAAALRSTARAAALARSYSVGSPEQPSPKGAVSQMVSKPFEYLMYVNVGWPSTRMLAAADTGRRQRPRLASMRQRQHRRASGTSPYRGRAAGRRLRRVVLGDVRPRGLSVRRIVAKFPVRSVRGTETGDGKRGCQKLRYPSSIHRPYVQNDGGT